MVDRGRQSGAAVREGGTVAIRAAMAVRGVIDELQTQLDHAMRMGTEIDAESAQKLCQMLEKSRSVFSELLEFKVSRALCVCVFGFHFPCLSNIPTLSCLRCLVSYRRRMLPIGIGS